MVQIRQPLWGHLALDEELEIRPGIPISREWGPVTTNWGISGSLVLDLKEFSKAQVTQGTQGL